MSLVVKSSASSGNAHLPLSMSSSVGTLLQCFVRGSSIIIVRGAVENTVRAQHSCWHSVHSLAEGVWR
jgi:hypothetical protein